MGSGDTATSVCVTCGLWSRVEYRLSWQNHFAATTKTGYMSLLFLSSLLLCVLSLFLSSSFFSLSLFFFFFFRLIGWWFCLFVCLFLARTDCKTLLLLFLRIKYQSINQSINQSIKQDAKCVMARRLVVGSTRLLHQHDVMGTLPRGA